jgi:hypothetical protein
MEQKDKGPFSSMGLFYCALREYFAPSVRMGWTLRRTVNGDSTAFLGCGTDSYGFFAPSGMRGTKYLAGLRIVSRPPAAGTRH